MWKLAGMRREMGRYDRYAVTDPTLIATPRFDLRSFNTAVFDALIAGDTVRAGAGLEAAVPVSWRSAEERALAVQRDRLQQDADAARWLMRAIVRRSDRVMVGHIGFHGAPGMEHLESIAPGAVEIGYTVFPEFRGQGIATEATLALMEWAATQGVLQVVASIAAENAPSLRIAEKLGFARVGEWEDEEDGPELVFVAKLG